MTPTEAATIIRRWRSRDEEANLAVRAVLQRFGYENVGQVEEHDPELLLLIHEAIEPLMGMEDHFAVEDALVREGRRDVAGYSVPLDEPNPATRNLELPPPD